MCLNGVMGRDVLKHFFMQEKFVLKDRLLCLAVNYLFLEARQQMKVNHNYVTFNEHVYYFSIIL